MSGEPIMRGREVVDHVEDGWELWHVSKDALPGRWELRRRAESVPVHWDAIEGVRRHFLKWFGEYMTEEQVGRYTWVYRHKQRALSLSGRAPA
ncbi:hypothetical protein [Stappia sp. ICDLI1TA098]